jgi:hypothetical protein
MVSYRARLGDQPVGLAFLASKQGRNWFFCGTAAADIAASRSGHIRRYAQS